MGAACPPIIPANEITAGLADHMAAFRIFIGGLSAATKDQGNAAGTNRRIHLFIHFDPPMNRFVKRIRANRFMGATKNLSRAPRTLTAAYCRIKNGKAAEPILYAETIPALSPQHSWLIGLELVNGFSRER